jgi:AcrR family transcriptional regulator
MPKNAKDSADLPSGGKRERTRLKLIGAAAEVIGEKGYDRASLEEIAARAGMTRGAVYGNFKGKEELFLAVVAHHWKPIVPSLKRGLVIKEQMRILGKTVAAEAHARQTQAVAATAFQLYVLTHKSMRDRVAGQNAIVYKRMAQEIVKVIPAKDLPMPAARFIRVLDALTMGLIFTYFQTPGLITESVFISAFEALA